MSGKKRRVDFIGIGVQKAGTTWIHANLDAHPSLFVARGKDKDTRFFTCFYDRGYQWYESHFRNAAGVLAGEVSTSYFYDSDAPSRIKAYNPDARLFVCLRNPVERIISNHRHQARAGYLSGNNLDLTHALQNNPAYLQQSRYATHLARWREYFDPTSMHILLFDDLEQDPVSFMSSLYEFLCVDSSFVADGVQQKANVSRLPASRGIEKAIIGTGHVFRRLGLGKLVAASRQLGFNEWLRAANTLPDEQCTVAIPDGAITGLKETLRPEIEKLQDMTGRDLRSWLA